METSCTANTSPYGECSVLCDLSVHCFALQRRSCLLNERVRLMLRNWIRYKKVSVAIHFMHLFGLLTERGLQKSKFNVYILLTVVGYCDQCDQTGRFFEVLGDVFSNKSYPIIFVSFWTIWTKISLK